MTSMTGYGYSESITEKNIISVEIKSVNSRFLDLTINLPPFLNKLESFYRNKISEKLARGKVDVFIRVKELESDAQIFVDMAMAKEYFNALEKVASITKNPNQDIPLSLIVSQPGVLNSNKTYDVDEYEKLITPVFEKSLDELISERQREGKNLCKDLNEKLEKLSECAHFFTVWQPKMESYFKEMLTTKFNELVGQSVDENRILTETAAMLVKYTINEEIVRLKSHIAAMQNEINNNPLPGKKLDFLCQEANREINTIGSKNQFAEVSAMVVKAKDSLENIREQAKNVE